MFNRILSAGAALAVSAALAAPASAQVTMKMVAHSDLKILDPIWTTAYISRNHGYMIYDTLFAQNEKLEITPQMVDKWTVSGDKLTWTFTLRDGLEFHDGSPVTTADVLPSLKRWAQRDGMGQALFKVVDKFDAVDAKTFRFVLKEPFGLVLDALGKPSSYTPFIMPKAVAETPADKQIDNYIGSGPYVFKRDEWRPGDKVVYVKNTKYKPRAEPASSMAGGKVVNFDRVEWLAIADPATAVSALIAGEIDVIEAPPPDMFPLLKTDKNIALFNWNKFGSQIIMRLNHLHPPFDNVKARQAVLYATMQEDYLKAQVGDPEIYKVCSAPLVCGTPNGYELPDGLLVKPNLEKARQLLKESGYDGRPIVILHQTDLASSNQLPPVGKQQLERAGFKVDLQAMDWQSVVSRRAKKDAPDKGGWNVFYTTSVAIDGVNPASNSFIRSDCDKAWFGWPCDPEAEKLREAFIKEADPAKQKELAKQLQMRVPEYGTYVPIGQYQAFGAYRKDRITGWIAAPVPVLWGMKKL